MKLKEPVLPMTEQLFEIFGEKKAAEDIPTSARSQCQILTDERSGLYFRDDRELNGLIDDLQEFY